MPDGNNDSSLIGKLDVLLDEYAKKIKQENTSDIISSEKIEPENNLNCRFRENCYTLKYNMGTCPCGLNE